jgi:hypothetical protein
MDFKGVGRFTSSGNAIFGELREEGRAVDTKYVGSLTLVPMCLLKGV